MHPEEFPASESGSDDRDQTDRVYLARDRNFVIIML